MHLLFESVGFGLVTAAVVGLAAVGLSLQVSVTNYINFAYGDFMTFGAYIAYSVAAAGVDFYVAVAVGGLVTGLLGLAANLAVFRSFIERKARLITLLVVTLGVSLILQNVIVMVWGTGAYRYGIDMGNAMNLGPFVLTPGAIILILLAGLLMLGLHLFLQYTRFGKAFRAVSNNNDLALASGIDVNRVINWTWVMSGFFAGIAGVGLVLETNTLRPVVGFNELFVVFAAIIMGGIGRPYGAMLGALIIGLATEMSGMYVDAAYKSAIAFAILVVVLVLRPQGIFAARGRTD